MTNFDELFKGSEKLGNNSYTVSSTKRATLIIPKGYKVFDEGTNTWYYGDSTTTGGIEFSDAGGFSIAGDLTSTDTAIDWDLIDNNTSALSFDSTDKTGILNIITTNSSEGLTGSGYLTIEGLLTANGGIFVKKSGTLVLGANSSISGSGFALSSSATAALKIYADDSSTLYAASAVRSAVFRNLVTIAHSNETSIFGSQSQFKIAPAAGIDVTLTTGNRGGSWNYCELAGLSGKTITLSGASKFTGGAFGMVEWDGVGTLVLSANHVLAAFGALTNVTKTGGTFTQTGDFAAFATLNNASASYASFNAGVYFGPNSVTVPFKFTDEADVASVTNGAYLADISATINAGYIKVLVGSSARYIALYELKAS